ncbi:hypothetical protein Tco_0992555 [Tanacetum coccineum]|uniref:Uncharacterized protein n=1 Tax=Tanacetum coccineum TaxID=301880 RepID=A0ABQ5F2F0_9ASTR
MLNNSVVPKKLDGTNAVASLLQMLYCFVKQHSYGFAELLRKDFTIRFIIQHLRFQEMKHTEHYKMYAEVYGLDVPLTQSQPTESTQGTHRTLSAPRNDEPNIPGTRLKPRSDKESPKVEITNDKEVEITNVVIPVNVNEEEEEITYEVYELKRREKGQIVEESMSTPFPTLIRSPRTHTNLVSSDTEKLQELTVTDTQTTSSSRSPNTKLSKTNLLLSLFKAKPAQFKRYKNFFQELQGRYTYLFEHLKERFLSKKSFDTLDDHLQEVMVKSLPTMVDTHIKEQVKKQVPEQKAIDNQIPSQVDASVRSYMSGYILHVHPAQSQTLFVPEQQYQLYLSMKDNPQLQQQDIAIWLALQMKFESLQVPQTTCRPSAVRPRDQDDPHDDAHPEGENSAKRQKTSEYEAYVSGESSSGQVNEEERDDDEIPTKQVSQDIIEEVSLTIDEAKLKKMADEMLRQRCTSGDEHQYHIDQMKNFWKSDIVGENPEALELSLINQDLLYLKKGSSGPEKIVFSHHKFPTIIFNNDDIEERTSRWVNKCVKKFNPYARYGFEHWKNPHAKIFYIKKQKEPGKPKEEVYLNSKIIQVIKTYWELGHEHKFITEIVARRANECIERVHDFQLGIESYQQKVNLTAPTISFPGVEKHKMFSIIYEPVHGIIYKNTKEEKRVMGHSDIYKFYDATLNRVLEGLKSYNNDVKYGYAQRELTNDEFEFLSCLK